MTTDAVAAQNAITVTSPPPGVRTMVDSAFPHFPVIATDIVLIYAGGDTPHPWTDADIAKMPQRWRWPCWVRSNPQQHSGAAEAALFAAWLHAHGVPQRTCVILDLETAVDTAYVTAFNLAMRAAGWRTTKYGSGSTIWKNPKTDGGTYLAEPGPPHMSAVGDTVATQWGYEGGYDLSWVKDQVTVPLWDTRPPGPYRHVVPAGNTQTLEEVAKARATTVAHIAEVSRENLDAVHSAVFLAYLALDAALHAAGLPRPAMPEGLVFWTVNP